MREGKGVLAKGVRMGDIICKEKEQNMKSDGWMVMGKEGIDGKKRGNNYKREERRVRVRKEKWKIIGLYVSGKIEKTLKNME